MWRYPELEFRQINGKRKIINKKVMNSSIDVCKDEIWRLPEYPKMNQISRNFIGRSWQPYTSPSTKPTIKSLSLISSFQINSFSKFDRYSSASTRCLTFMLQGTPNPAQIWTETQSASDFTNGLGFYTWPGTARAWVFTNGPGFYKRPVF